MKWRIQVCQVAKARRSTFKVIESKLGVQKSPVHALTQSLSEVVFKNDGLDKSSDQNVIAPPKNKPKVRGADGNGFASQISGHLQTCNTLIKTNGVGGFW